MRNNMIEKVKTPLTGHQCGSIKSAIVLGLALACPVIHPIKAAEDCVSWVNPMIGTDGANKTEYGGTMPLVTAPFGMTNWVAMTRENRISRNPYHYQDKTISGFIGTHQPAIWMGDYGQMAVMPGSGDIKTGFNERAMAFNHSNEIANPCYYRVTLSSIFSDRKWKNADEVVDNTQDVTERKFAPVRSRFWRLHITKPQSSTSQSIASHIYEIQLFENDAPLNLAVGGVRLTSSASSPNGEDTINAVDGNLKTKWCVKSEPSWLEIDLGEKHTISGWKIQHAGAGGEASDLNTRNFSLQTLDAESEAKAAAFVPARITTEMAATERCTIMRFTYPDARTPHLVVDGSFASDIGVGSININAAKQEITGWNKDRHCRHLGPDLPNFSGYFAMQIDTPFTVAGINTGSQWQAGQSSGEGNVVNGAVIFPEKTTQVQVRIGTSFISIDQARANLLAEIPAWNFDAVKNAGKKVWNEQLSRIEIEGGDADDRTQFYTNLYHCYTYPRIFSEYGKYYSAFDDKIHDGVSYNDYSMWDTFRGLHPLLTLTASERVGDMVTALLQMYKEGGWLPKWPNPGYTGIMIGSHSDAIIADAWVKGIRNFDLQLAYEACRKNAFVPQQGDETNRWRDRQTNTQFPETRGGLTWYLQNGWVACDKTHEATSRTLEFAYNDFCVAQLAKAAGKEDDYAILMKRSQNYKNLWHDGFMNPRNLNGTWADIDKVKSFTEGGKWTYLFCVMQDIPGLIELMGGKEAFAAKLDENFEKKHYRHDNEPGHHYPYLYNYCDQPWKTQKLVREIMREHYKNKPDGYSGNDDCGQMSAWYVLSSLGFYSVTPGSDIYALGSPLWKKATLHIGEPYAKAVFTIIANNQSPENVYVQSVNLNGKPLLTPFIRHSEIVAGGTLEFDMGPNPKR